MLNYWPSLSSKGFVISKIKKVREASQKLSFFLRRYAASYFTSQRRRKVQFLVNSLPLKRQKAWYPLIECILPSMITTASSISLYIWDEPWYPLVNGALILTNSKIKAVNLYILPCCGLLKDNRWIDKVFNELIDLILRVICVYKLSLRKDLAIKSWTLITGQFSHVCALC